MSCVRVLGKMQRADICVCMRMYMLKHLGVRVHVYLLGTTVFSVHRLDKMAFITIGTAYRSCAIEDAMHAQTPARDNVF